LRRLAGQRTLARAMAPTVILALSSLVSGLALRAVGRAMGAPDEIKVAHARMVEQAFPFANAGPGDDVVVSGTAAAGPEGPLVAPISKTSAAWVRVETTEERSADADASFVSIATVRRGGDFEVVQPDNSRVLVRMGAQDVGGLTPTKTGPVVRPSAALAAFLEGSGAAPQAADDFVRRRECIETALSVGQDVFVLGVKRAGRAPSASAYRDVGDTAWVEPTIVDVELDAERIRILAQPDPPGIGVVLGWIVAVGGPVLAPILLTSGNEPDVLTAFFAPPLAAFGLWIVLGFLKFAILD
jgi:hypothetical protein